MRSIVGTVTCGLVLASGLAAQDKPNPVRVRLTSEVYRAEQVVPDSQGGTLALDCDLLGAEYSTLRVQSGEPGMQAALLISPQPAGVHFPGLGTLLVSPNAVTVQGVFDGEGVFEHPIDLARFGLAGHTVYVQALEVFASTTCGVSQGLAMQFTAGNHQPPSSYVGPPLSVIPCKAVDEYLDQDYYSVLLEFRSHDHTEARVVSVHDVGDRTQAIVVELIPDLNAPPAWQGGWPIAPPKKLRTMVDLGGFPKPLVEIWVATPVWAPPEEPTWQRGIDPPDASYTDAYVGDILRIWKAQSSTSPNGDADHQGYIICYGPDVIDDQGQVAEASTPSTADGDNQGYIICYGPDVIDDQSQVAEASTPSTADGDHQGYIICYGPDVNGDLQQPVQVQGTGFGSWDKVPTDKPRDSHFPGLTFQLPPGWCIFYARAAVVDLRY